MKTKLLLLSMIFKAYPEEAFIHPWDNTEMTKWSKKLGINSNQLNDAILDTGSLNIKDIKKYLREKGVLFSFKKLWQNMQLAAFLY